MDAIKRLGKDPRGRCFSRAPWTDKEIGMSQTLLLNRVFQRLSDVVLAKYIVEVLGSIFARKDLVTHGSTLFHDCQAVATILSLLRCDPQASSIRPCGF